MGDRTMDSEHTKMTSRIHEVVYIYPTPCISGIKIPRTEEGILREILSWDRKYPSSMLGYGNEKGVLILNLG
jgi:hypothetical protein